MITQAIPDVSMVRPLLREPEFEMRSPCGASGLIVSPLHVKTTDGKVLLMWDGQSLEVDRIPSVDQTISDFVASARKGVRRFPQSSRAHTSLGIALLRAGEVSEAIGALERSLALRPSDQLAMITLGDALLQAGKLEDAERMYYGLLGGANDERVASGLAAVAILQDDFDKAHEYLRSALATNVNSARLRFMLGIIDLRRGDVNNAIGSLRAATHLEVRNAVYHHALGVVYAIKKEYGHAELAFKSALSLIPTSRNTVNALGRVQLDKGDPVAAIALLAPYLEARSDDNEVRQLLAHAYIAAGRHSIGRSHLKHILQSEANLSVDRRVALLNAMAVSFMRDDKPRESELALQSAIEIGPTASSIPYENLGRVYFYHLDRDDSARAILRAAKRLFPESQTARVLLAIALAASEDYRAALEELEPFHSNGTADESTYICLGWLYQRTDNEPSAILVLKEGLARFPHSLGIINNLAYTYLMGGKVNESSIILAGVPSDAKLHAELVATFGLLQLWRGREKEGRALYEHAEEVAATTGRREIVRRVRQKRNLELARYFVRRGETKRAQAEIEQGLAIASFPLSYRSELEHLRAQIDGVSGVRL